MSEVLEEKKFIKVPNKGFFFVPLGGVGEIGMNFCLYSCDGKWLAVDCGVGFAGENLPGIEMLLPDPAFATTILPNLEGLVITHAHEDHLGAVGYLWRELHCPIYATPFVSEMLVSKLDEVGLLGRASVEVVNEGDVLDLGPFEIELIPVNHSVPEATALFIKTKYGNIFHTGDWRFDKEPVIGKTANFHSIKNEKILALIGDSTNVFVEDTLNTETDVRNSLVDLLKRYKEKKIVVTCFASNVGRIESISFAAEQVGRKVCLMGKSLWRVEGAGRASGYFKDYPVFLTDDEAKNMKQNEVLYICTGCQGEYKAALNSISYDVGNVHLTSGDVVVFSSRVIPGNEQAIANIQNRFIERNIEFVTTKEALVHVSGHAGKKDMKKMYEFLKPQMVIPVHGEIMHLNEHAKIAQECGINQVLIIKDGEVVHLDVNDFNVIGEVPTGILAVDGKKIVSISSEIIKKRRRIIEDGSVVATVVLNSDNNVVGDIQFSAIGLIETESSEYSILNDFVISEINALSLEEKVENAKVSDVVKSAVRKIIVQNHGRRPLVDVHIVRV